jgi:hypothetical protein
VTPNNNRSGSTRKNIPSATHARASVAESESPSQTAKGRIVEKIVASMLERPDVQIQRNRKLLVPQSQRRRRREIDVLVTRPYMDTGPPFPIECKNESKPIGTPKIDAFVGKLADLGITTPRRTSPHVATTSRCGYTQAHPGWPANVVDRQIRNLRRDSSTTGGCVANLSSIRHRLA